MFEHDEQLFSCSVELLRQFVVKPEKLPNADPYLAISKQATSPTLYTCHILITATIHATILYYIV